MDQHIDPAKTSVGSFEPGSSVVYALHGKCTVVAVEERVVSGQQLKFYKLEVQKSALSRSTRQEPAIWLPVNSAIDRGMRRPMDLKEAEGALAILSSREYYFSLNEPWSAVHPQLEAVIRREGGIGLAKAYSYLSVLKKRLVVLPPDITRLFETIGKQMIRELTEALHRTPRSVEEQIQKGLRHKLLPSH